MRERSFHGEPVRTGSPCICAEASALHDRGGGASRATNEERRHKRHIVIVFILLVSNSAGLLTPLGDPPLCLGYRNGVPFYVTLTLWKTWLLAGGIGALTASGLPSPLREAIRSTFEIQPRKAY